MHGSRVGLFAAAVMALLVGPSGGPALAGPSATAEAAATLTAPGSPAADVFVEAWHGQTVFVGSPAGFRGDLFYDTSYPQDNFLTFSVHAYVLSTGTNAGDLSVRVSRDGWLGYGPEGTDYPTEIFDTVVPATALTTSGSGADLQVRLMADVPELGVVDLAFVPYRNVYGYWADSHDSCYEPGTSDFIHVRAGGTRTALMLAAGEIGGYPVTDHNRWEDYLFPGGGYHEPKCEVAFTGPADGRWGFSSDDYAPNWFEELEPAGEAVLETVDAVTCDLLGCA